MKPFLLILVFFCFGLTAFGQQDSGFTNKAEAKNLMVNGKKEGKWIEYMGDINMEDPNNDYSPNADTSEGYFYRLGTYKGGQLCGKAYEYRGWKLYVETIYKDGKKNGTSKWYYENGKVHTEIPYVNDTINGIEKDYDMNGVLRNEYNFTSDKSWRSKNYNNGKIFVNK